MISDAAQQAEFNDVHANFGINHRAQCVAQTFFGYLLVFARSFFCFTYLKKTIVSGGIVTQGVF